MCQCRYKFCDRLSWLSYPRIELYSHSTFRVVMWLDKLDAGELRWLPWCRQVTGLPVLNPLVSLFCLLARSRRKCGNRQTERQTHITRFSDQLLVGASLVDVLRPDKTTLNAYCRLGVWSVDYLSWPVSKPTLVKAYICILIIIGGCHIWRQSQSQTRWFPSEVWPPDHGTNTFRAVWEINILLTLVDWGRQ